MPTVFGQRLMLPGSYASEYTTILGPHHKLVLYSLLQAPLLHKF